MRIDIAQADTTGLRLPYVTPWAIRAGELTNHSCIWRVATDDKVVALTFDDGPSLRYMPSLLDALTRHRLRATFFILGSRIDESPEGQQRLGLLSRAAAEGHEIALHGLAHRSLFGMPEAKIVADIKELRNRLESAGGMKAEAIRYFRPPFGQINSRISRVLGANGLVAVNATIVPGDAMFPKGWKESPDRAVSRILRNLSPGAIICLHVGEDLGLHDNVYDAHQAAKIIERLAPELELRGYRATNLADLLAR